MKSILIVEAGVNHNGNFNLAKKLIDQAKKAGAEFIKFQFYNIESMITPNAVKADYQKKNSKFNENQYKMLKRLSLNKDKIKKLYKYSKKKKINFLLSVFDEESYHLDNSIRTKYIKIPSGEITNIPLLEKIKNTKKKIILSTGASSLKEIKTALKVLKFKKNSNKILLLHCVSLYPTPINKINLGSIDFLRQKLKINVGLSDHTKDLNVPLYAISMGANIVEKHFTLNKKLKGPDHKSSINPKELRLLIKNIKNLESIIGLRDVERKISYDEKKIRKVIRKSIYAKKNIEVGEKFSKKNIVTKRPDVGISSNKWNSIIKKKSKFKYLANERIK